MKLLLYYLFLWLFSIAAALPAHANFTASLLKSQRDMTVAHGYFQMQTSRLTEDFDEAINLLGLTSMPQLAVTVDTFNNIYTVTEEILVANQAHFSCFNDWRFDYRRQGGEVSKCTDQLLEETQAIYQIFQLYALIGELLTNEVPLRGLQAFRAWRPLTDPDEHNPVRFVNNELRWDLDIYRFLIYDFLVRIELDVLSALEAFETLTQHCVSTVIGRLTTDHQSIVDRALLNECSGQV